MHTGTMRAKEVDAVVQAVRWGSWPEVTLRCSLQRQCSLHAGATWLPSHHTRASQPR
jgi:hypothetical protein